MSISVKTETITPEKAHANLAKSPGNREINWHYVLSLVVAMEQGKWNSGAEDIVFDEDDAFIDGHHRMHAVIQFGKPVEMLVKRGVTRGTRNVLNTGRPRSIADLFKMTDRDDSYLAQRKASLNTCISLIVPGTPPSLRTLDAYDSWMRQFKEGVDAMIELGRVKGKSAAPFRIGPVSGALAFAYKTAPKKITAFAEAIRDGEMLTVGQPAYTIRTLLSGRLGRSSGGDRMALSKKVLSAALAELESRSYGKAQAGEEGLTYFRKAYDHSRPLEKLVDLWTPEVVANAINAQA
jgi:hypothetical protein